MVHTKHKPQKPPLRRTGQQADETEFKTAVLKMPRELKEHAGESPENSVFIKRNHNPEIKNLEGNQNYSKAESAALEMSALLEGFDSRFNRQKNQQFIKIRSLKWSSLRSERIKTDEK